MRSELSGEKMMIPHHGGQDSPRAIIAQAVIEDMPKSLIHQYPSSPPCSCPACQAYCARPGWWTVAQARDALEAGLGRRMMMEISPNGGLSVLAPAFRGNEGLPALRQFAARGCCFLSDGLCELYGLAYRPLECGFCHHGRPSQGLGCHLAIARDWDSAKGRRLCKAWWEGLRLT